MWMRSRMNENNHVHYSIPFRIPRHASFSINITFTFPYVKIPNGLDLISSISRERKKKKFKLKIDDDANGAWMNFANWNSWDFSFAICRRAWRPLILCFTLELIAIVINVKVNDYYFYCIFLLFDLGFFLYHSLHSIRCKWRSLNCLNSRRLFGWMLSIMNLIRRLVIA